MTNMSYNVYHLKEKMLEKEKYRAGRRFKLNVKEQIFNAS